MMRWTVQFVAPRRCASVTVTATDRVMALDRAFRFARQLGEPVVGGCYTITAKPADDSGWLGLDWSW